MDKVVLQPQHEFKELVYDIKPKEMGSLVNLSLEVQSFVQCMGFARDEEEREMWRAKWVNNTLAHLQMCEGLWVRYRKPGDLELISPFPLPTAIVGSLTNQLIIRYREKGVKKKEVT